MIERKWIIQQIAEKWRDYVTVERNNLNKRLEYYRQHGNVHPDSAKLRDETVEMHKRYYRFMIPARDKWDIPYHELTKILREAEKGIK